MKLELTFAELSEYISTRYKRIVSFSRVNDTTVSISTKVSFLLVNIDLAVVRAEGTEIEMAYNGGFGVDMVIGGFLSLVKSAKPEWTRLVEAKDGQRVLLHLDTVERLRTLLSYMEISRVGFTDSSIELIARIK